MRRLANVRRLRTHIGMDGSQAACPFIFALDPGHLIYQRLEFVTTQIRTIFLNALGDLSTYAAHRLDLQSINRLFRREKWHTVGDASSCPKTVAGYRAFRLSGQRSFCAPPSPRVSPDLRRTTGFATQHHCSMVSSSARSQPSGTGARRLFSPSVSKQSHP